MPDPFTPIWNDPKDPPNPSELPMRLARPSIQLFPSHLFSLLSHTVTLMDTDPESTHPNKLLACKFPFWSLVPHHLTPIAYNINTKKVH